MSSEKESTKWNQLLEETTITHSIEKSYGVKNFLSDIPTQNERRGSLLGSVHRHFKMSLKAVPSSLARLKIENHLLKKFSI